MLSLLCYWSLTLPQLLEIIATLPDEVRVNWTVVCYMHADMSASLADRIRVVKKIEPRQRHVHVQQVLDYRRHNFGLDM